MSKKETAKPAAAAAAAPVTADTTAQTLPTAPQPPQEEAIVVAGANEFEGHGAKASDVKDYLLPRYYLVQSGHKRVKKGEISPNKFLNGVSNEQPSELLVLPLLLNKVFVEWIPRLAGGGYVAKYAPDHPLVAASLENNKGSVVKLKTTAKYLQDGKPVDHTDPAEFKKEGMPSRRRADNDLVETDDVYFLTFVPNEFGALDIAGFGVYGFTSVQKARRRAWWTSMGMSVPKLAWRNDKGGAVAAPYFACPTRLVVTNEPHPQGDYASLKAVAYSGNWSDKLHYSVDWQLEILRQAKNTLLQIQNGVLKAQDFADDDQEDAPTGGGAKNASEVDEAF